MAKWHPHIGNSITMNPVVICGEYVHVNACSIMDASRLAKIHNAEVEIYEAQIADLESRLSAIFALSNIEKDGRS